MKEEMKLGPLHLEQEEVWETRELSSSSLPKPGLKPTEFYLALVAVLAGPLLTHADKIDGPWGVIASAIVGAVYAALRTSNKNETIKYDSLRK
jgi:hypothetical protein